jgi:hypothetical protein
VPESLSASDVFCSKEGNRAMSCKRELSAYWSKTLVKEMSPTLVQNRFAKASIAARGPMSVSMKLGSRDRSKAA